MRLLLTSEARFERTPDGVVWSAPAYGQALWARYLDVFSSVVVAGRVSNVPQPSSGSVPASSTQVAFCDLPVYSGLAGFVWTRDLATALKVSEALECGLVGVNDWYPFAPEAPFGGMKQSGLGRESGLEGVHEYVEAKTRYFGGL